MRNYTFWKEGLRATAFIAGALVGLLGIYVATLYTFAVWPWGTAMALWIPIFALAFGFLAAGVEKWVLNEEGVPPRAGTFREELLAAIRELGPAEKYRTALQRIAEMEHEPLGEREALHAVYIAKEALR